MPRRDSRTRTERRSPGGTRNPPRPAQPPFPRSTSPLHPGAGAATQMTGTRRMRPRTRSPSSPRSTSARGQGPGGGASSVCAGVALGGTGAGSGAGGALGGTATGAVSAANTHPLASHATVESLAAIPVNSLDGGPTLRRVPAAGSITTGRSAPRRAGANAATRSPAKRGAVRPATPVLPGSCPTGTPGAPVISRPSIAATTRAPSVMSRWRSSISPECRPTSIELLSCPVRQSTIRMRDRLT